MFTLIFIGTLINLFVSAFFVHTKKYALATWMFGMFILALSGLIAQSV